MKLYRFMLAAILACPALVLADDNELTLEALLPTEDSFVFGKYNGLDSGTLLLNPGFRWSQNDGTASWQLTGKNLSLDTRQLNFSFRRNFVLKASYSEISHRKNNAGFTPYSGHSNLVLPQNWTSSASTSGFDQSLIGNSFQQDSKRKILTLSLERKISRMLNLNGQVSITKKTGTSTAGAAIYSNAANPLAVILPAEIDHTVTDATFTALVDKGNLSIEINPRFSRFENDQRSITWQHPYSAGLGPAVDYPNGTGGLSGAPDYDHHSITLTAAYRLPANMRILLTGVESRTSQEQDLPFYTANPLLDVTSALPMTKLDGELETRRWQLSLLTRPLPRLNLNFQYQFRERENTATRHAWNAVIGDGIDQPAARFALFGNPLKRNIDRYRVDAIYRLQNHSRLTARYEYEETYRNFAAVRDTEHETWTTKLRSQIQPTITTTAEFKVANKAGSTYEWSRSFFQSLSTDQINRVPDDQRWSNHPLLRQFHLANFEDRAVKWTTNWIPSSKWQAGFDFRHAEVTFDKSELGLTESRQTSFNLSGTYNPSDDASIWLWLNGTQHDREQTGRDFRGGVNKPANRVYPPIPEGSNPNRNYKSDQQTTVFSIGLGTSWQISERVRLASNYVAIQATEKIRISTYGARDLSGADLPDTDYKLHDLNTTLSIQVHDNLDVSVTHRYFRYEDDNFQYRNLAATDLQRVLGTGEQNPDEVINFISLTLNFAL